MAKSTQNIFQIIINGTFAYIKNILSLTGMMLFPVLGQLVGIVLILYPAYWLPRNFSKLTHIQIDMHNLPVFCLVLLVSVLPGFFVFAKAFWEYMVAMASLSLTAGSISRGNAVKDDHFKAYSYTVKSKSKSYVSMICVLSFIWLLAVVVPVAVHILLPQSPFLPGISFLLSLIALTVASVYLSLSFQVFAFEEISFVKVMLKSWELVKGNFIRVCFLGMVLFAITSVAVPYGVQMLVDKSMVVNYAAVPLNTYFTDLFGNFHGLTIMSGLPQIPFLTTCTNPETSALCITDFSRSTVSGILAVIITGLMLPLGSICYTFLYLDIIERKSAKK